MMDNYVNTMSLTFDDKAKAAIIFLWIFFILLFKVSLMINPFLGEYI